MLLRLVHDYAQSRNAAVAPISQPSQVLMLDNPFFPPKLHRCWAEEIVAAGAHGTSLRLLQLEAQLSPQMSEDTCRHVTNYTQW
jgi:hypothetical protein